MRKKKILHGLLFAGVFVILANPVSADGDARLMVQLPHGSPPSFLAYSHDGRRIVSLSLDNSVKVWSLSGKILHSLSGHKYLLTGVAISENDDRILSADGRGEVILWSREGKLLKNIRTDASFVGGIAFLEKQDQFVTAAHGGEINIWSMQGSKSKNFKGHSQHIRLIAANPKCNCFLTGTEGGEIGIWNSDGTARAKVSVNGSVSSLHISADGQKFLAGTSGSYGIFGTKAKTATLWDMTGKELQRFASETQMTTAAMTPDGSYVALGLRNDAIQIFDTKSGTSRIVTLEPSVDYGVMALALHPGAQQLAVGSWGEGAGMGIRDWAGNRMNTGKANRYGSFHTNNKLFHASDYGNLVVSAEKEGGEYFPNVLKLEINRKPAILVKVPELISCLTARLTMNLVVVGTLSGAIKIFDLDGQLQMTLPGHIGSVNHVGFTGKDGTLLATGGTFDGAVKLWDLKVGKLLKSFEGHVGSIDYVEVNSEKQVMASFADHIWYLWNAQNGSQVGIYNGPGDPLTVKDPKEYVVVSMDGRFDYGGDAHEAIHWAVGDETIPLEQFREKYQTAGLLAEILAGKSGTAKAIPKPEIAVSKRLVGRVFQIKANGDVVIFTKVSGSLRAGKKLRILNGANYVDATIANTLHTNVTAKAKGSVAVGNPVFE